MFEYHRNNARKPIGVLFAKEVNGEVRYGWSLCNKCDSFDREFGKSLAEARADKYLPDDLMEIDYDGNTRVPESMVDHLVNFSERAEKYFKNAKVAVFEKDD